MLLVIGLTIVIVFAVLAILVDPADGHQASYDPRSELPFWAFLGRR